MKPFFLVPIVGFNGARLPEARKLFQDAQRLVERALASMEPGFLKPGNLPLHRAFSVPQSASMEPGFLKPGNPILLKISMKPFGMLQWSQAS